MVGKTGGKGKEVEKILQLTPIADHTLYTFSLYTWNCMHFSLEHLKAEINRLPTNYDSKFF